MSKPTTKRIKRRKPSHERKQGKFNTRLTKEQDALICAAAKKAKVSKSDWGRDRLIKCAEREVKGAA